MKHKASSLIAALLCTMGATAQVVPRGAQLLQEADRTTAEPGVSPVRRIQRGPIQPLGDLPQPGVRSIDGTANNPNDAELNAAETRLARYMEADYTDGIWTMVGQNRPGPREVSNAVNAQASSIPNGRGASDFFWQRGQFLDHDIDLTDGVDPLESEAIVSPSGDPWFDPSGSGIATMAFNRSVYDPFTGIGVENARQQLNEITGWIDASNVYGSDVERATALRTNDGTGMLRTSDGGLLPFNTQGLLNAGGSSETLFLAGDARANEQVGLTVVHTLFVREHNRLAGEWGWAFYGSVGEGGESETRHVHSRSGS